MRIAVASDHRGFESKKKIKAMVQRLGHEVTDFGCNSTESCDYPDMAILASRAVADGQSDLALLFDGSGVGMCITANKINGIRAALVHDEITSRRSREHNHCNALCLACDLIGEDQMRAIVETFLSTTYAGGRHARRVARIDLLEQEERTQRRPVLNSSVDGSIHTPSAVQSANASRAS